MALFIISAEDLHLGFYMDSDQLQTEGAPGRRPQVTEAPNSQFENLDSPEL